MDVLYKTGLFAFLLLTPAVASAQWHVTGVGGTLTRLQTGAESFANYRNGPASTTTLAYGFEGGRSIWKVTVDGTFLRTPTGQTIVIIGSSAQASETDQGHGTVVEGGAEWPLLHLSGFQLRVRAGYGRASVQVPTQYPIDDQEHFWTYGFTGTHEIGRRYLLRLDFRNVHFRRLQIPETLGRFNVMALAEFGLRF